MEENRRANNLKLPLLQEAVNFGILDIDSVLDTLMASKRENILKIHPYAITPPASEGGRWQTCYKDEKGKRKNIKAQSKEEWLAYKATVTNSSNTIKRHKQRYRKYFEPSVLHGRKVKKIDELMLE